jgi:hypothetical protein
LKLFLEEQGLKVKENGIYWYNQSTMKLETNGKASSGNYTRYFNIKYFHITDLIHWKEASIYQILSNRSHDCWLHDQTTYWKEDPGILQSHYESQVRWHSTLHDYVVIYIESNIHCPAGVCWRKSFASWKRTRKRVSSTDNWEHDEMYCCEQQAHFLIEILEDLFVLRTTTLARITAILFAP